MSSHEGHITIAVDAMGGDFAPAVVVAGTLDALTETRGRFTVLLVGRQEMVEHELAKSAGRAVDHRSAGTLHLVDAPEVIEMHDLPNAALKSKRNSSISLGLGLQREGKAQAFVSAGNTGAVLSASTLILGRIEGVGRPTIGALLPTSGNPCFLVDAGTNVDCRPNHLFEFGVMGSIYVSAMLKKERPSVGLLSIGEEESKGNDASLQAFSLFRQSGLNFIGNVEGRDILKGKADVVVCDGFVGNILLKFGESIPGFFKAKFLRYSSENIFNRFIAAIARNGMRSVMKELDYQEHGGVPLLGINGVSIIGHGGSTSKAIKNMILRAEEMVQHGVNNRIRESLQASAQGAE